MPLLACLTTAPLIERNEMERPSLHLWLPPVRDDEWVAAQFGYR
ncbi:hypothetical protein BH24ACT1_BH24ACT1_00420 [soil metagenome]